MSEVIERLDVALVQADTRWAEPQANRDHLAELMDRAPGADLYVLPETCTTGFLGDAGQDVETMDGPGVAWFREQARSRHAAVTGSIVIGEGGKIFNRMLFATPEGEMHRYDKRHLFGYGGENARYTPGASRTRLAWRGWRVDLQVCYDLRFPVWCRNDDEFELQVFVANWPAPRAGAWAGLLRARAIENQSFVVGVNRVGEDGNSVAYPGRSSAWDPEGGCLEELDDREQVARVELDHRRLAEIRETFPFLADRDRFRLT